MISDPSSPETEYEKEAEPVSSHPLFVESSWTGDPTMTVHGNSLPYDIEVICVNDGLGLSPLLDKHSRKVWKKLVEVYGKYLEPVIGMPVDGISYEIEDDSYNPAHSMFLIEGIFFVTHRGIRHAMTIQIRATNQWDPSGTTAYTVTRVFCFFYPIVRITGEVRNGTRLLFTQHGAEVIFDWIVTAIARAGLEAVDFNFKPPGFQPRDRAYYEARLNDIYL